MSQAMLRSQRILLIAGLLFIAWLLHVNLCDWIVNGAPESRPDIRQREVLAFVTSQSELPLPGDPAQTYTSRKRTGVFTQSGLGYVESFTLGVIVPLLLLLFIGYLALGARQAIRMQRGLCAKCGYDLRGTAKPGTPCPECGTKSA